MRVIRRPASRGEGPWAWLSAGSVALSLLALAALLLLLMVRGLGHFWPDDIALVTLDDGRQLAGVPVREAELPGGEGQERLYRIGNPELAGGPWAWVPVAAITGVNHPRALVRVERRRGVEALGWLVGVTREDGRWVEGAEAWRALQERLEALEALRETRDQLREMIVRAGDSARAGQDAAELSQAQARIRELQAAMDGGQLTLRAAGGEHLVLPLETLQSAWRPNAMAWTDKLAVWGEGLWRFLSEGPRAANTQGGVWPAIFGTMLMVILMSVMVMPFGVLAAIYLNEVAHQGRVTRLVRIGVRNLAGVPSIVYGVFGLGVFVYGLGGTLDAWFFADRLPSPTFGTGGLLWASLTLALLTLPVVIVATEEGLARIPDQQREGALALGATRLEMLTRVVLPMATPAMLTGLILAVARAAGEVAPLMLVGVAKLAPQVPVDDSFPFLHLDRKFMHLGYHVYDTALHSGDVQAAMPLAYATALLLVLVILVLNLTAIFLRHHLRLRHGMPLPR